MKKVLNPKMNNGVAEVQVEDLAKVLETDAARDLELIDVRRPDEFNAELGHIKGARRFTLGPELTEYLVKAPRDRQVVFICRSGGRSTAATQEALQAGCAHAINMAGGMMRWNEVKLPIVREDEK